MKKSLIIWVAFAIVSTAFLACENIMDTEPNIDKTLIEHPLTPTDTLKQLLTGEVDMGRVKIASVLSTYCYFKNVSEDIDLKIYAVSNTNQTGLFTYEYPKGLPFELQPSEDTEYNKNIRIKFHAAVYNTGYHYDTLILNNNQEFRVPIKVYVWY